MHHNLASRLAINWKNDNDVKLFRHDAIIKFFKNGVFLLSNLVAGPCFMSITFLVLEFSFEKDWPEIRKLEMIPSDFSLIFGDWGEL